MLHKKAGVRNCGAVPHSLCYKYEQSVNSSGKPNQIVISALRPNTFKQYCGKIAVNHLYVENILHVCQLFYVLLGAAMNSGKHQLFHMCRYIFRRFSLLAFAEYFITFFNQNGFLQTILRCSKIFVLKMLSKETMITSFI